VRTIDIIFTALRNIRRQKLRSVLTIFAVVIGATSVTIMLALVTGVKSFFVSQFSANGTLQQISISPKADISKFESSGHGDGGPCDSCVKLTDALTDKIKVIPHVTGVAREYSSGSLESITYNGTKLSLQQALAYDANGVIANTMVAGRDIAPADTTGVITINTQYADKWGFKGHYSDILGKTVQLTTRKGYGGVGAVVTPPSNQPGNNNDPQQQPATVLTATIVGVVGGEDNDQSVRAPLVWVRGMNTQQMYQMTDADRKASESECRNHPGPCNPTQHFTLVTMDQFDQQGYNGLVAKVDDPKNAAAAVVEIKKLGVGAADAESLITAQLTIFNITGYVLGGIGAIALLVATIGVINTMVMAILERTREIGVLRACGATKRTIRRLFTVEAGLLGFLGGVFGVILGYGLTIAANVLINRQLLTNSVKANNIIALPLWLIVGVIGATTLIGMLAGLYPAMRAARLNPVDALRYE